MATKKKVTPSKKTSIKLSSAKPKAVAPSEMQNNKAVLLLTVAFTILSILFLLMIIRQRQ